MIGFLTDPERTELNSLMADGASARLFVEKLYSLALDRAASTAELDAQTANLPTAYGNNRAAMLNAFLGTPEYAGTIPTIPAAPPVTPTIIQTDPAVTNPAVTNTAASVPLWMWGAGAAAAAYFLFLRKR